MKLPHNILFSATLFVCIMAKKDLDFIDTDPNGDGEAALKCDACTIIIQKVSLIYMDFVSIFIF